METNIKDKYHLNLPLVVHLLSVLLCTHSPFGLGINLRRFVAACSMKLSCSQIVFLRSLITVPDGCSLCQVFSSLYFKPMASSKGRRQHSKLLPQPGANLFTDERISTPLVTLSTFLRRGISFGLSMISSANSLDHRLLAHDVVDYSTANLTNFALTLEKREGGNSDSGTECPDNRHKNPEGKERLRKDPCRDGEDWPHHDKNKGEEVSTANDPALGTADFILVKLILTKSRKILFDEKDLRIQSREVIILRIDELGVDIVDESRTQNCHQVSTEHDWVGSKSCNIDDTTFDLSSNEPANKCKDESTPCGNYSSFSRSLIPSHHVPERNNSRSNNDSHEEVDPS